MDLDRVASPLQAVRGKVDNLSTRGKWFPLLAGFRQINLGIPTCVCMALWLGLTGVEK
jgi:hypothetical protein